MAFVSACKTLFSGARLTLLSLFLGLGVPYSSFAAVEEITGIAQIVDGDTFKIDDKTIHLFGIDAPDIEQQCRIYQLEWPCGQRSIVTLERLIAQKPVRCELVDTGSQNDDKLVHANCYNYENVNLNSAMIGSGMALPLLSQSQRYATAGRYAKIKRLGLWSGRFIPPAEWREGKRFRPIGQPFKRRNLKD